VNDATNGNTKEVSRGRRGPKKGEGGRPKGVPNRRSWDLRLELEAAGFEPLTELLDLLAATTDQDVRWNRLVWLFKYLYPQLKEIEPPAISAGDDSIDDQSGMSTADLLALVAPQP